MNGAAPLRENPRFFLSLILVILLVPDHRVLSKKSVIRAFSCLFECEEVPGSAGNEGKIMANCNHNIDKGPWIPGLNGVIIGRINAFRKLSLIQFPCLDFEP